MATLILEDGTRYEGTLFGHKAPVTGEVVFTTGMTGYQETLTDPSYCGQIVCMTYPLMGNVGINDIDSESAGVRMRGFIVSELCDTPSNWQMKKTLDQYLDEQGVTGLCGVDTRALTRHVREYGTLRGRIVEGEPTEADLALVRAHEMHDQVAQCTCKAAYDVQGDGVLTSGRGTWREAVEVMVEYGAAVAGFSTLAAPSQARSLADTAREALEARGADLCLAATLQVFQRDAKQQNPTAENPYYSPDTMMPAALELRAAGVQFLRAAGQATPAYTGVLAATVAGLDVAPVL